MEDLVNVPGGQGTVDHTGEPVNPGFQQPLQPSTDDVKGEEEHQRHNPDESGDGGVPPGKDGIDLPAAFVFFALPRLDDRLVTELLNEGKAHVCDGGCTVQAALFLHLADDVLQHFFLVLTEVEGLQHQGISLHQLTGSEAKGNLRGFGMVLHQVHNPVEAPMDGAVVVVFVAEVGAAWALLILGNVKGMVHQFLHPFVLGSDNRHHGDAQQFLHFIDMD